MIKSPFKVAFVCFVLAFQSVCAKSLWEMDPYDVRNLINQKIMSIEAEKPVVLKVTDITLKIDQRPTPVRIYTPNAQENLPIILLIHGGAWVAGNLDTHDNMARYLCKEAQALVVSVGYLNSPEGKFPQPLEQCYDALLWIAGHAQEFHADAARLAVVGDSAGGNMAAALCLLARDRQGPKIILQVLINPSPDLTGGGTIQPQGDALDTIRWYASQYVSDPKDAGNPYVSPMVAKDLSHLPPAVVILAEHDDLRGDGQKYADRLKAEGVETQVYTQWGIGHLAGDGARASYRAKESLDITATSLRRAFQGERNDSVAIKS